MILTLRESLAFLPMDAKTYSPAEVSKLAHITVRALHHYDEIGLLVPSHRNRKGYRRYTDSDLRRLQRILILRQLGFALDAIQRMLDEPNAELGAALLTQRELLRGRMKETQAIIRAIESAINALERGEDMDSETLFDGFDDFDHTKYEDEARERWGHTEAYREYARRTKDYSKEDIARMKVEGEAITARLAGLLASGAKAESDAASAIAEEHRLHIERWFYPCTYHMHAKLGDLYVSDTRFTQYYEKHAEGLAQFMRAAIHTNSARYRDKERERAQND